MTTSTDLSSNLGGVHDLLFRLLATEMGLLGPAHPQAQFNALIEAYPALKSQALAQLETGARVSVKGAAIAPVEVPVTGQADALAFAQLYRGIQDFFGGSVESPDDYGVCAVLEYFVLPLAAKLLFAPGSLREAIAEALRAHHAQFGREVQLRNLGLLANTFRCDAELLAELSAPAPDAAAPTGAA